METELSYNSAALPIMQSTTTRTTSQGKRTRIWLSQVMCGPSRMTGPRIPSHCENKTPIEEGLSCCGGGAYRSEMNQRQGWRTC